MLILAFVIVGVSGYGLGRMHEQLRDLRRFLSEDDEPDDR